MSQIILATVTEGMLKPDSSLELPAGTRVRVTIEPLESKEDADQDWAELEKLWDEVHIDSGGKLLTRDELHERR